MKTINALANQTLDIDSYEVIIVDDGSYDKTEEYIKDYIDQNSNFNIKYIRHEKNKGKSTACNKGIYEAIGPIIVFTDDDIIPTPSWLEAHLRRHQMEKREVSVTGLVLYPKEWEKDNNRVKFANSNYSKNISLSKMGECALPPNRWAGGNTSVPKKLLVEIDGFDNKVSRGEDVTLGYKLYKLGIPLLFEPKAIVFHHSEIIHDLAKTLEKFKMYYYLDVPVLLRDNPEYIQRYGHWFLMPLDNRYDNFFRLMLKKLLSLLTLKKLQRLAMSIEKLTYDKNWLYFKPLYQYIYACEARIAIIEGIKQINRSG